jgi:hypothetical protein
MAGIYLWQQRSRARHTVLRAGRTVRLVLVFGAFLLVHSPFVIVIYGLRETVAHNMYHRCTSQKICCNDICPAFKIICREAEDSGSKRGVQVRREQSFPEEEEAALLLPLLRTTLLQVVLQVQVSGTQVLQVQVTLIITIILC